MKFYFVLELFTCCFFITPFIGAVPNIVKTGALVTGETVVLTCTISGYVLAEWKKGSSAALTTCTGGGSPSCSPLVSDRYTFSTTQNTITVSIDNLNRADDGTTWICNDAGAGATDNIVLDPILTQQSGIPTLTESSECQEITCESSCIAPFASSDGSFTWTYIPDGGTAQPLTNPSPTLSSSSDGCPSSEGKVKSTLTSINKPTGFKDNVKFQCDFSQNGFTSSWTATSNECFKGTTVSPSTTTTTPGTTATNTTSGPTKNTTSGPTNHTEGSTTNTISSTTASSNSLPVSVIIAISAGVGLVILVGITIAITCYCKRKSNINETVDDKHRSGIDNHGIDLNEHSNRDHHL